MPSRFLPSLAAAAALQALLLGSGAAAAEPAAGLVVAQLGPTSPGFKMNLNRGQNGAPEATGVGPRPMETRDGAATDAQWHSSASHPSTGKDAEAKTADRKDAALPQELPAPFGRYRLLRLLG